MFMNKMGYEMCKARMVPICPRTVKTLAVFSTKKVIRVRQTVHDDITGNHVKKQLDEQIHIISNEFYRFIDLFFNSI